MRAIKVNPETKEVTEIEISSVDFLKEAYAQIGCETIDVRHLGGMVDVVLDDEGLLKEPKPSGFYFAYDDGAKSPVCAGTGLLVSHNDEGETLGMPEHFTVGTVARIVRWVNADELPEPEFSIITF